MTTTPNNAIPWVPENTTDPAAGVNDSLRVVDALLQPSVLTLGGNSPPGSPADGDRHIVGTAPTGAWAGQAGKLARWMDDDGAWEFHAAVVAVNQADSKLYIKVAAGWVAVGP